MTTPRFDITPFLEQDEGQHFERKSLFEGPERTKSRPRRAIRDDVAENVAAFANAEGGVLVLGIEDEDLNVSPGTICRETCAEYHSGNAAQPPDPATARRALWSQ